MYIYALFNKFCVGKLDFHLHFSQTSQEVLLYVLLNKNYVDCSGHILHISKKKSYTIYRIQGCTQHGSTTSQKL